MATVAVAFHKRSLLLLVQCRVLMFEMTRDVPWAGTKMLAEPVSASDITARVEKTTHPDMKNSRVVPMRPEKGYISLVRRCPLSRFLALVFFLSSDSLFICLLHRGWGPLGIPYPLSLRIRRSGPRTEPEMRNRKR